MKTQRILLSSAATLLLAAPWFSCPAFAARIVAWGYNAYGQCNVPDGNDFVAIAAGQDHSLALRADGSIVAWGTNEDGRCNVPAGSDFVAIAAGDHHSLAIRSNGSLVAWGDNDWGQCDTPSGNDFVAVAGGFAHSLALRSDGSVVAWGCGFGDRGQCEVPQSNDLVAIAAYGSHSLAVRSNGSLVAWGDDRYGRCDVPEGNDFVVVATGAMHNVALRADGSLAAAGSNPYGQLDVPKGNDFVAIAAGIKYSLALKADGSIVAWGGHETNWGQLDVPEGYHYVAIAAGTVHNVALVVEPPAPEPFIYVDAVNGNDTNNGQTPETAYATIQKGIDSAKDGYTVLVQPGLYLEPESDDSIDFLGKNITLRSVDPTDWDVVDSTVIRGGVQFSGTEGPNCTLTGFTIHDRYYGAIYGQHTHATISHCVISGNGPCGATVIKECDGTISNCLITDNTTFFRCGIYPALFGCNGLIKNCTIVNNISGISLGNATIENCIIYNNSSPQLHIESGGTLNISYSNVAGGLESIAGEEQVNWGPGNIDTDPCFVRSGYPLEEPLQLVKGEYHLKSAGWRRNKESKSWTYDYVTSRCVDAGNPGSPLGDELMSVPRDPDNEWGVNLRINMGAYGGTSQASMAPHGWALLTDLNNDGIVNCADLVEQAMDWLADATEQPGDLKRDGVVDMKDFSALSGDWLQLAGWLNSR